MANIPLILQQNWHIFGEHGLLVDCLYMSTSDDTYDTNTGIVTPGTSVDQDITIIFDEFNQTTNQSQFKRNDDVSILSIDKIANFPALNLNVEPKVDDLLLIDSVYWIVKGKSIDPAKAKYSLHVRPI